MWSWFSCKKYSESLSRSLDGKLSLYERARVGFHFLLCLSCRRFAAQVRSLQQACKDIPDQLDELAPRLGPENELSQESRSKMIRQIADELKKHP